MLPGSAKVVFADFVKIGESDPPWDSISFPSRSWLCHSFSNSIIIDTIVKNWIHTWRPHQRQSARVAGTLSACMRLYVHIALMHSSQTAQIFETCSSPNRSDMNCLWINLFTSPMSFGSIFRSKQKFDIGSSDFDQILLGQLVLYVLSGKRPDNLSPINCWATIPLTSAERRLKYIASTAELGLSDIPCKMCR